MMKKILMALAITAFAYTGVEAQVCKTKTIRHKRTVHTVPVQQAVTSTESCRLLPYKVCKIMPDRKTVSCYQTTDLDNLTPLNNDLTLYGATGTKPADVNVDKSIKTIIIPGESKGNYCKRDKANRTTTCFTDGKFIGRDDAGFYNYNNYNGYR